MSRGAVLVVTGVILLGAGLRAQDGYKIVVNPSNTVSSLSKDQLSKLFLGKSSWDDGSVVAPIDQLPASAVREVFSRDVFGMSPEAVLERLGRDSTQRPAVASDRDVLAYVRLKPGAIGYVSATADVQGVKVIGLGKSSGGSLPIPLSGNMPSPVKILDADPVYPVGARAARVQGAVDLLLVVGATGNVEQARVVHSIPLLDDAAIAAVKKWKYKPFVVNGTPAAISMMVRINFAL